jgi:hypothetical protein
VFEHYESEYLSSTRSAAQNIEQIHQLLPGAARDELAKKTKASIETADEICSSMELEARSLSGVARQELVAQAKDYKTGIAKLRQSLKAASTSSRAEEAKRDKLLGGADPVRSAAGIWPHPARLRH